MSTGTRGVRLDPAEASRLAVDCRRIADVIDEHVALLRTGDYRGLRDRRSAGYRPAVDAVAARLARRSTELRAAARGLATRSSAITESDDAAARRIAALAGRRGPS
ncbi:hypothetical protein [Gordonia sp. (in: high G+C Gram-positive bacteria)]|uniref:hypothetical protein n=1 Tax=Gordonia sp. (in: high G+C Gram-positive bacteria) TaxID=84139 RepID=UPI0039E28814